MTYGRSGTAALRLLQVLAVAVAIGGCGLMHREPAQTPQARTQLTVRNVNWLDVVVYVIHDGQRSRLGVATASASQTFDLTRWLGPNGTLIQLSGDPIGRQDPVPAATEQSIPRSSVVSERVAVTPGQRVVWTLETDLARSSLAVY